MKKKVNEDRSFFANLSLFFLILTVIGMIGLVILIYMSYLQVNLTPKKAENLVKEAFGEIINGNFDARKKYFSKRTNLEWDELLDWEKITENKSEEVRSEVKENLIANARNLAGISISPDDPDWYEKLITELYILDITSKIQSANLTTDAYLSAIECRENSKEQTITGANYIMEGASFEDPSKETVITFVYEADGWKVEANEFLSDAKNLRISVENAIKKAVK